MRGVSPDGDLTSLDALARGADASLQACGLQDHKGRVALCLDISGSMQGNYLAGKVQRFAERVLGLAMHFDADQAVDVFLCGHDAHVAGAMKSGEHHGWVSQMLERHALEQGTRYGRAIETIRKFYFPDAGPRTAPVTAPLPVYVMFVTDGRTSDEGVAKQQLTHAAMEPIFWQFMGLGRSRQDVRGGGVMGLVGRLLSTDFSFLEALDTMEGRLVDNAGFFSVEDPDKLRDDELYGLLMKEYPRWVAAVRELGMIP